MGGSDWAACATCAPLIERNRWTSLTSRAVAVREGRDDRLVPPEERTAIAALHRQVRQNITGSIRPIEIREE